MARRSTQNVLPVLEVSQATYQEITNRLLEGGYDWLVFPDIGYINLGDFLVQREINHHELLSGGRRQPVSDL